MRLDLHTLPASTTKPCAFLYAPAGKGTLLVEHLKKARWSYAYYSRVAPQLIPMRFSSRNSSSTHSAAPIAFLEPPQSHQVGPSRQRSSPTPQAVEEKIEKVIYACRFMTFFGVWGSLLGSLLCFLKGCVYVVDAFREYYMRDGKVILMLVEAIDVYLIGTVMLVFGMGLYELFISNLGFAQACEFSRPKETPSCTSSLFGMFMLMERPRWLEIKSINELKTKLGHVIVMALLVGLFEKTKKAVMCSSIDLLCFSAAILVSSCGLYLLSKLNEKTKKANLK